MFFTSPKPGKHSILFVFCVHFWIAQWRSCVFQFIFGFVSIRWQGLGAAGLSAEMESWTIDLNMNWNACVHFVSHFRFLARAGRRTKSHWKCDSSKCEWVWMSTRNAVHGAIFSKFEWLTTQGQGNRMTCIRVSVFIGYKIVHAFRCSKIESTEEC